MECLVRGAVDSSEPGVFMAFEENTGELATNFAALGSEAEIKAMLVRMIDFFKMQKITALFTSLITGGTLAEEPLRRACSR